jgi:hypothetical protein
MGMMSRAIVVFCLAMAVGCGSEEKTALRVVFELNTGVEIEQVRVQVVVAGATVAALDVPDRPGPPLETGADMVLLFDDADAGQTVEVYVAGLAAGAQAALGSGTGTLRRGATVSVTVRLQPASCGAGGHACGGGCYPDDDTEHCGLACVPCPEPVSHGHAVCLEDSCQAECDGGYDRCGAACVDLQHDRAHCGSCARACGASQICQGGNCAANPCPANQHPCGSTCVSDHDVATCGSLCTPCPTPANGMASCDGTSCGVTCSSGFHLCGGGCVSNGSVASCGSRCTPCPEPDSGYATCSGNACGVACDSGFHACGAECVENTSILHCGSSCTPCTVPLNGNATCTAGQCGVTCDGGYQPCGDECVPTGQPCTAAWVQRVVSPAPVARAVTMAFDSDRGVAVLFGGFDGTNVFDDTWEWDGSAWVQAAPSTKPSARSAHATVYDPVHKRTILFGGADGLGTTQGDTWAWNGSQWSQVATTGPSARYSAQAAWSPTESVVLLIGGNGDTLGIPVPLGDVWAWNGTSWQQRAPTGTAPTARGSGVMWFDSDRGEALLFGGSDGTSSLVDLWALSANAWSSRTSATMAPRTEGGAVFHESLGLGLFFGGADTVTAYGDTWVWNGTTWSALAPANPPPGRAGFAITYDSWRAETVVFGGATLSGTGTFAYNAETWVLSW